MKLFAHPGRIFAPVLLSLFFAGLTGCTQVPENPLEVTVESIARTSAIEPAAIEDEKGKGDDTTATKSDKLPDRLDLSLRVSNQSKREVVAFKGILTLESIYQEPVHQMPVEEFHDSIKGGQGKLIKVTVKQAVHAQDQKVPSDRIAPESFQELLKYKSGQPVNSDWESQRVVFSDGYIYTDAEAIAAKNERYRMEGFLVEITVLLVLLLTCFYVFSRKKKKRDDLV